MTLFSICLFASAAQADVWQNNSYSLSGGENPELTCQRITGDSAVFCVSKAAIAKDKAELQLIQMQQKLLSLQIQELEVKKENKDKSKVK